MKKEYIAVAIAIIVLGTWYVAAHIQPAPLSSNYADALASCGAYPNNSTQTITETTRLSIKLPKSFYPNQGSFLSFSTKSGTAQASWISNAGPVGESAGATPECWAYYYEFDGAGQIDLAATSSKQGVPDYVIHFVVSSQSGSSTIEYKNSQYGFTFALPQDWQGYTIVPEQWTGNVICSSGQCPTESGPELLIRNPNWSNTQKWQDIPIMIFTHAQWNAVLSESMSVSAAPILPSKLGENTTYVFALPARYNYAFPEGWQEVEAIMQTAPLRAIN